MAKGAEAKVNVANRIAAAFGSDWVGEYEKKYYVWGYENGEKIQICISMTCPKNPIGEEFAAIAEPNGEMLNFEDMSPTPQKYKPAEITQEEQNNIQEMMKRLGL